MTSLSRTPSANPAGTPRISGPVELIQAVPYLLGFHPQDSLVLVGTERGRLVVTARMDLADVLVPGMLADTVDSFQRAGVTTVVGLVYVGDGTPAHPAPWATAAGEALDDAVTVAGGCLAEMLVVTPEQWWSAHCDHTGCTTVHGGPIPAGTSDYAVAATVAGVAPMPDRAALEAVLDPVEETHRVPAELIGQAERDAVAAVLGADEAELRRTGLALLAGAARASGRARWSPPDDEQCARLAVALTAIPTRDEVWMRIDEGRLDGRPLWLELARRLPGKYRAPALVLYGWAMWRHGNGALARVAAERAVQVDPQYTAADLLMAVLLHKMNPHTTPRLRRRVRQARSSGATRGGENRPPVVRKRARTRGR